MPYVRQLQANESHWKEENYRQRCQCLALSIYLKDLADGVQKKKYLATLFSQYCLLFLYLMSVRDYNYYECYDDVIYCTYVMFQLYMPLRLFNNIVYINV